MEEEIDLREYIAVLFKYWYWIIGAAILAAAVAFGISSVLPPTYEAKALVVVTNPRYRLRFDSRIETLNVPQPFRAYPALATSDTMLTRLAAELGSTVPAELVEPAALADALEAKTGSDPSLIELVVRHQDPQVAAHVANRWAEVMVRETNSLYGQSETQLVALQAQLETAEADLQAAEAELTQFWRDSGLGFLDTKTTLLDPEGGGSALNFLGPLGQELAAKTRTLAGYRATSDDLTLLRQQADLLRGQVAGGEVTAQAAVTSLTVQMAQVTALDSQVDLTVQVNSAGGETLADVEAMIGVIDSTQEALETSIETLAAEVAALQTDLAGKRSRFEILNREHALAQEVYLALARKVQETQLVVEDESNNEVRVASQAIVPQDPVGPRRAFNTVVAGGVASFVALFAVVFLEFWRSQPVEEEAKAVPARPGEVQGRGTVEREAPSSP